MRSSLILFLLQLWGDVQVSRSQNETCSKLPDVPHASVSEETRKAEYQHGDLIRFTCEIGYISGPTIRYVCGVGGWMASHHGSCYLKPCELPGDTPNGYYQLIHGSDFVFGATIKYFCNQGYQMMSRDDTRTCLLNNWTNHLPICDHLSCNPPPSDDRITITGFPENDNPILPDRFLTFSCDDPGKYLNGSSILVCGKDGQWDKPFPTCEEITCKVGVMHRHLRVARLPPADETIKPGHRLQFRCSNQYDLEGAEQIECLQTGEWNPPFPTCAGRCTVTGVSNSVRIITPLQNNQLRKGERLNFACHQSEHNLQGKAVVECSADGQWSDPFPTCEAPLGCSNPPPLEHGDIKGTLELFYRNNEKVEYTCQNLFTMMGEPFRTCVNGEWKGRMRCLKPCTVDSDIMSRHNIAFKYIYGNKLYATHDDAMEFRCTGSTSRVGAFSMRQRCVDGVIHLPTCQ